MKINKEWLKQFDPCIDRWKNYLKHYSRWEGTLCEFLELENISTEDKHWVLSKECEDLEKFQRQFVFQCACRAVDGIDGYVAPIKTRDYLTLIYFIYESNDLDLLNSEEYQASRRASYRASDWASDQASRRASDWASYWASDWASYWASDRASYQASDWASDQKEQIKMAASLAFEMGL